MSSPQAGARAQRTTLDLASHGTHARDPVGADAGTVHGQAITRTRPAAWGARPSIHPTPPSSLVPSRTPDEPRRPGAGRDAGPAGPGQAHRHLPDPTARARLRTADPHQVRDPRRPPPRARRHLPAPDEAPPAVRGARRDPRGGLPRVLLARACHRRDQDRRLAAPQRSCDGRVRPRAGASRAVAGRRAGSGLDPGAPGRPITLPPGVGGRARSSSSPACLDRSSTSLSTTVRSPGDRRPAVREVGAVVEYEGAQHQEDRGQYVIDIGRYAWMRRHGVRRTCR